MKTGFDRQFMTEALALAIEAGANGEIPVGAVVVKDGRVIGRGANRREQTNNVISHAEMDALSAACEFLGDWRLDGCTLYVTLEPCPMCAGAIINARVDRVVFGAYDLRAGSFGSVVDLSTEKFDKTPEVFGGICEDACAEILTDFFKGRR
ncbi:MAG: nucleoside deaminase [Clostridia bacterium]|nr:nucleoside deaminase [Clostridia bacterium]